MPQRSSIELLPAEKQDRIAALCADKSLTLDKLKEITEAEMGEDAPSRSALGRHRLKIEEVAKLMRASREAAQFLKSEMGDLNDDEQSRLNYEMLQGQLFQTLTQMTTGDSLAEGAIKDMRGLADALMRLSASRKTDTDRIVRIKQLAAKETADKAIAEVDKVADKTPGLSKDTVDDIKRRILGIAA